MVEVVCELEKNRKPLRVQMLLQESLAIKYKTRDVSVKMDGHEAGPR